MAPSSPTLVERAKGLLRWFPESWREIDETRDRPFGAFERNVIIVAAVGLVVMHFFGSYTYFLGWFGRDLQRAGSRYFDLLALLQWIFFCVVGYLVIPGVFLKLSGRRIRDYYFGWRGTGDHLKVYLTLLSLVLIPVVVVSFTKEYQHIYPFYPYTSRSWFDLLVWELAYGLQFLCLEFFFRAFLLEGLRRAMGHSAIFVMLLPYCMVHFQKTWTESLGSLIAGIILGTMAMRYRSIWGGALLHWLVAIAMDVASLLQKGELPPDKWM